MDSSRGEARGGAALTGALLVAAVAGLAAMLSGLQAAGAALAGATAGSPGLFAGAMTSVAVVVAGSALLVVRAVLGRGHRGRQET